MSLIQYPDLFARHYIREIQEVEQKTAPWRDYVIPFSAGVVAMVVFRLFC